MIAGVETIPELRFAVEGAAPVEYAASPSLGFGIRIGSSEPIRSIVLDVQLQIAARRRRYEPEERERLFELFGLPEQFGSTLRTLLWTRTTLVVPPFEHETVTELVVPCSYDLEVSAARYLAALGDGEVPLELLFSGTCFYGDPLRTARLDHAAAEAGYRLPVAVWRETMDRHFPGSAWLRVRRETFDRLVAYKARGALTSFDEAVDRLLGEGS